MAGTSYTLDDELLSVQWMKVARSARQVGCSPDVPFRLQEGKSIVAGTQEGTLLVRQLQRAPSALCLAGAVAIWTAGQWDDPVSGAATCALMVCAQLSPAERSAARPPQLHRRHCED